MLKNEFEKFLERAEQGLEESDTVLAEFRKCVEENKELIKEVSRLIQKMSVANHCLSNVDYFLKAAMAHNSLDRPTAKKEEEKDTTSRKDEMGEEQTEKEETK